VLVAFFNNLIDFSLACSSAAMCYFNAAAVLVSLMSWTSAKSRLVARLLTTPKWSPI